MKLEEHPTVQRIHRKTVPSVPSKKSLDAGWLKQLVLDVGADDVGFVEIDRPALDDQRQDIYKAFPHTEFHHSGDEVNDIARSVVQALEDRGIRAMKAGEDRRRCASELYKCIYIWTLNRNGPDRRP